MSDITRQKTIDYLYYLKIHYPKNLIIPEYIDFAISSLEIDEAYQLEYESTTKNDIDFKLKDYVSREAVRRIIKSPRSQEQMLNALNSLRNATECKEEDCINRDYTAKYVEEFANNEYVSQDEAETIYLIADGIRHIPSALPKVTKKDLGVDAVSRQALIDWLRNWTLGDATPLIDFVNSMPAVTPQLSSGLEKNSKKLEKGIPKNDLGVDYLGVDCISRKAVLDAIDSKAWEFCDYLISNGRNDEQKPVSHFADNLRECVLEEMISVTPQEPKTGHWVKTPKAVMGEGYMWYCDKCEHQVYQDSSRDYPSEKYCPNCGAKMVEPQESEEV